MSFTNSAETAFLELLFNNVDWTNIGDAGGILQSASPGSLYVSLHTASPGEAGDQTTNECAYTGYARVAVARSAAGWTVSGNVVDNFAAITFPACTAGPEVATHWGIGTDPTGAGNLLIYGALTVAFSVIIGIAPEFPAGDLDVSAD